MLEEIFRQDNAFAFEQQKNYILVYIREECEKKQCTILLLPYKGALHSTLKYIGNILEHTLYYYY